MNEQDTIVSFSDIESGITGLKISRCNSNYFNAAQLYRQIVENRYDLCRLKVPAEDEYAPYRLHQTGLPFFFSGSIRKYRTRIADMPPVTYHHPHLTFETYNGTQDKLLRDMLVDTWGQYPLGYYRSPYLSSLVTKEQEIECVFQYYKKHNLNSGHEHNKIMFMKDGDNYVGVFTLNQNGNTLECNLAGILKPYRSGMYFHDEMNFKKAYCLQHGFEYFTFGARNENAAVQRIFQHLGFETAGNDNVFHITPLLSYSVQPFQTLHLNKLNLTPGQTANEILNAIQKWALKQQLVISGKFSLQINNQHLLAQQAAPTLKITMPVKNTEEIMLVLQPEENTPAGFTCYVRWCSEI
jgi:hypothetical protein